MITTSVRTSGPSFRGLVGKYKGKTPLGKSERKEKNYKIDVNGQVFKV
jgi:hypothetical protein